jgi:hypothetical protein
MPFASSTSSTLPRATAVGPDRSDARAPRSVLSAARVKRLFLHDVVLHALRAQTLAQVLQLADLQAAVVGDDDRGRPAELFRERVHCPALSPGCRRPSV